MSKYDKKKYYESYLKDYYKDNYKKVVVSFRTGADKDIIDYLEKIKKSNVSITEYIRRLIQEDMKRAREEAV